MVAFSANDPRTATLIDSTTVSGVGYLLTNDSTNNKVDLTANNEIAIGVSMGESSRDADHDFETTGATVSYFPLGGVLMVQSAASATYTTGCLVYVGASGLATATAGSNKVLGIYVGEGQTTSGTLLTPANGSSASEGELIPVMTAGAATA